MSKNVTKILINAVATISSKIVQDTNISYDSSQIIYVKDTKGDVIIRGNTMIQHAYINMQALFNAMSSESAQQNLALEIAQSAKSLTSGINIGQYSEAINDLDVFIQTSIQLTSVISQQCSVLAAQEQEIIIEHTIGSVTIENNVFEQVANIFSNCIQTSINNSEALQSIILKLSQDASATSKGVSEWFIIGILAVVLGVPAIGTVILGKDILKFIFPVMIIVGIIMIFVYYYTKKSDVELKAYSKFIENTNACLSEPAHPKPFNSYASPESAADYCLKSNTCSGFDWKGLDISSSGSYSLVKPPQTKFYKSVSNNCRTSIQEDNSILLRSPVVYFGNGDPPNTIPNLIKGDVWINTLNSIWYQLKNNWEQKTPIISTSFSSLLIQTQPPLDSQKGNNNDKVVVYNTNNPNNFDIYTYKTKWISDGKVNGPGYYTNSPPVVNSSGIKENSGSTWVLYGGISLIIIGVLGTIVMMITNTK